MLKHALLTQLQEYNNGKGRGELNMRSRGRTSHVLSGMFNLQHCLTHCCSDCSNNISFFQVNKLPPKIKKKVKEKILHKEVHVRRLLCRINCSPVTYVVLQSSTRPLWTGSAWH